MAPSAHCKGGGGGGAHAPGAAERGVHGDAHDAGSREARKFCVLELLPHRPGYQVALRQSQPQHLLRLERSSSCSSR